MGWLIESVQIAGGFLGDLSVELPKKPALVCIIGPRGSGKSTLVEALRFAFTGLTGATKQRQDLIAANLGQAVVTATTISDGGAPGYVVNRRHRQEPSLVTRDGKPVANVDLDRGSFLPLDVYGSLEIEAIADESLGEKRRSLIDELHKPEHRELLHALAAVRRELEANADAIRHATQKAHDLDEKIEELGDVKARLDALPAVPGKAADAKPLAAALAQQQANVKEAQFAKDALAMIAHLTQALPAAVLRAMPQSGGAATKNARQMSAIDQVLTETVDRAKKAVADLAGAFADATTKLKGHEAELAKAHAEQDAAYRKLQAASAETASALSERAAAQQALVTIKELEVARAEVTRTLDELREARAKLRADHVLRREQVSAARERIAAQLEKEAGKRVRVRVERNQDNLAYRQMLGDGLSGARVRNHEEILDKLTGLRPERLAELVEANAAEDIRHLTEMTADRAKRVVDAFRENVDPFALEIVPIEDRIAIELDVGPEGDSTFKDASELSRGQKCTALLPLLLARRDTPLLIDQPEDNLDNHFIYETVVEAIRRLKTRRQMIFVTHNANIPVLGEADLVICMNSDGRRGFVSRVGTVDACRGEIIDLLEGGREAFDLRRKRYDRK